jgi:nucleotidyltransferase AbiEii toxin of type IV toxin-antitoxin system
LRCIDEVSKHSPEVAHIGCIDPAESAADKLSAIAWRIPDRVRGGQDDDPYLVRHIHDLAILKDAALQHGDFSRLVTTSMRQDNARPRNDLSILSLTAAEKFQRMMDVLQSDIEYAQEYKRFVYGVSYATLEQTPDFTSAIETLRKIVDGLRLDTEI